MKLLCTLKNKKTIEIKESTNLDYLKEEFQEHLKMKEKSETDSTHYFECEGGVYPYSFVQEFYIIK